MKRVLFDSDVIIDVMANRQPFIVNSAQALNTVATFHIEGYVAGHAVTNIFYILRRRDNWEFLFSYSCYTPRKIARIGFKINISIHKIYLCPIDKGLQTTADCFKNKGSSVYIPLLSNSENTCNL